MVVRKVRRCSDSYSIAADALSKMDFKMFRNIMPDYNKEMSEVPNTILRWLSNPLVHMEFGKRILTEMSKKHKVLGYNA